MGEPCGEGRSPLLRLEGIRKQKSENRSEPNHFCFLLSAFCFETLVRARPKPRPAERWIRGYLMVTLAPASSKAFLIFSASSFETPSFTV